LVVRPLLLAFLLCACSSARVLTDRDHAIAEPPTRDIRAAVVAAEANARHWAAAGNTSIGGISSAARWEFHGPQNLSGITYCLLFDPENVNVYLAGSYAALWRSEDSGANWVAMPDLDGLQVMSLARDPRDSNVIYAATGFEGIGSDGIYKSIDRGLSWRKLEGSPVSPTIRSIAISPDDSNVLLAGTSSGVFRSSDAGQSWTQVVTSGVNSIAAFAPGDGSHAVVGTRDDGTPYGRARLMYSVDGGVTFKNATGIDVSQTYSVYLTYAPSVPGRVYAAPGGSVSPVTAWRSDDGGQTYKLLPADFLHGYHIRNTFLATPVADFVIYAGIQANISTNGEPLRTMLTSKGPTGFTWPHTDFLALAADPGFNGSSNRRVFACTDGGIFVSDDPTQGVWKPLWQGASSTQYYAIDVSAQGTIVGGLQDNGVDLTPPDSLDTVHMHDADTVAVVFDPTDDQYCYAGEFGKIFPCSGSSNAGIVDVGSTQARFGDPMAFAPSDRTHFFVASMTVMRIDNIQSLFPKITTIRAQEGQTHYGALAIDPTTPDIVWLADDAGRISRTTNALSAAPAWTTIFTGTATLSAALPSTILIDRHDPRMVYVGADSGILLTTDDGATWQSANGSDPDAMLPSIPVRKILEHPTKHGWLYAGTPVGLFISADSGSHWTRAPGATTPAKLDIRDLVFRPNTTTLYVATYGRGVWSIDVPAETLPRHHAVGH
jgi:photosystem II stability/assembly factor-like uncharacterized protein